MVCLTAGGQPGPAPVPAPAPAPVVLVKRAKRICSPLREYFSRAVKDFFF